MNPATHTSVTTVDPETIENLLGDLELSDAGDTAVIEHVELDAASESAVETAIAKSEAYEEQPVTTTSVEAPPSVEAPAKTTKAAKTPKEPKTPRVPRELSALAIETFEITDGVKPDRDAVIAGRPTQKKIGEKFDNLFQSIAAGKKPSVYTIACFQVLAEKRTATSMDLVGALKAATVSSGGTKGATYNEGTARSQAGQMMALFANVGIATRDKQTLTFVPTSPVASKLSAILAA